MIMKDVKIRYLFYRKALRRFAGTLRYREAGTTERQETVPPARTTRPVPAKSRKILMALCAYILADVYFMKNLRSQKNIIN